MIFVIEHPKGGKLIAEKEGNRTENAYTIKMACDEELRTNGAIDLNNLAEHLIRNDFKVHQHFIVKLPAERQMCDHPGYPICPCTEPESWKR